MLLARALLATLALGIFLAPLGAEAQQAEKVPRIGFLSSSSASAVSHILDAFRQGLRERGWVEGQNIAIEYRFSDVAAERLPDLAADLVRLKVDIILAGGPPAAFAASKATTTIPIVFVNVALPVELGLIASLARPGGNITGVSFDVTPETNAKPLQLLKEITPKASRIAVIRYPANPNAGLYWKQLVASAHALGVRLQSVEVRGSQDFESAFIAITRGRPDALFVEASAVTLVIRKRIADFALNNRLATAGGLREFVDAGGLMSYGPSIADNNRRAAAFVAKILKGAKPSDLPVEQPTKFELVINMKTAKALGLTIPQSLLLRADQVIE